MRPSKTLDLQFGWTWLPKTWALFSKAYGAVLGFALLSGFITIVLSIVPVLGKIASGFFYPLLLGGAIRVLSVIDQGRTPQMADFFAPLTDSTLFRRYLPMCLTCGALMLGTAIISGILIFGLGLSGMSTGRISIPNFPGGASGTVLLTLIGSLVTLIMGLVMAILCLYGPALVDLEGVSAKEGMEQSLILTSKNWLPFLLLGIVYMLPALAPMLPGALLFLGTWAGVIPWFVSAFVVGLGAIAAFFIMIPISFCLPYILYKATFPTPSS